MQDTVSRALIGAALLGGAAVMMAPSYMAAAQDEAVQDTATQDAPDEPSKDELARKARIAELAALLNATRTRLDTLSVDALTQAIEDTRRLAPDDRRALTEFTVARARLAGRDGAQKNLPAYWREALAAQAQLGDIPTLQALSAEGGRALSQRSFHDDAVPMLEQANRLAPKGKSSQDVLGRMRLQYDEIAAAARSRGADWRRIEFRLEDMRRAASDFPMWSLPRLMVAISEANIRVVSEPYTTSKSEHIDVLYKEAGLIVQALDDTLPDAWRQSYRELSIVIDDFAPEPVRPYHLSRR